MTSHPRQSSMISFSLSLVVNACTATVPASTASEPVVAEQSATPQERPVAADGSCDGVVAGAQPLFERRNWRALLDLTETTTCWMDREQDRVRLRTTALFHVERWDECATLAPQSDDPDIQSFADLCWRGAKLESAESK
jgi:hypothetical protein